jgi:hypothetical protein
MNNNGSWPEVVGSITNKESGTQSDATMPVNQLKAE